MLHRTLTWAVFALAAPLTVIAPMLATPAMAQAGGEPRGGVNGDNVTMAEHGSGRFERTGGQWQLTNGVNIWQANWVEKDASGRVIFNFVQVQEDEWSVYLLDASRDLRLQIDLFRGKIRFAAAGQDYVDLYDITAATGDDNLRWSVADTRRPVMARPPVQPVSPVPPRYEQLPPRQMQPRQAQPRVEQMAVRPLANQGDANRTCPVAATVIDGEWTGAWTRVGPSGRSTCEMQFGSAQPAGGTQPVEAGPIWSQADADNKCRQLATRERAEWTGGWWTTQPGVMSVCELRYR